MDKTKFRALVAKCNFVVGECWIWPRATKDGYTFVYLEGKQIRTHRASYETFKGPIPPGLEPDHTCRNRACMNPDHLEAVTHRTNVLRGEGLAAKNARKTHCKNGHPYDGFYQGMGRCCMICKRAKGRRNTALYRKRRIDGSHQNQFEQDKIAVG